MRFFNWLLSSLSYVPMVFGFLPWNKSTALDIKNLEEEFSPGSGDFLVIYENTSDKNKKVNWSALPAGGGGGGEANTASNVGTAGVGVFKQKVGVNLEFKKINAASAKIVVSDDVANSEVDINVGVLAASDITSGTFADARIAQSNVTQHQAALSLAASQITSGTLAYARGGLNADVSSYDGYIRISSGATSNIKSRFSATTGPGVSDDGTQGYAIGSRWLDTTNDKEFVCLDNSTNAAVWKETTPTVGGSSTQVQYNDNGVLAGAPKLTYSKSNDRVGINEPSPGAQLQVTSSGATSILARFLAAASQSGNLIEFVSSDGTLRTSIHAGGAIVFNANSVSTPSSGSALVRSATDTLSVFINGSEKFRFDASRSSAKNLLNLAIGSTVSISNGAITVTNSFMLVDTEGQAATDDLDVINGGLAGDIVVLKAFHSDRTVVVRDLATGGNINLAGGDFSLDNSDDTITLIFTGSRWIELARANNGT